MNRVRSCILPFTKYQEQVIHFIDLFPSNWASGKSIENIRVRPVVALVLFEGCAMYTKIYLTNDYYKSMLSVALPAAAAVKATDNIDL